MRKNHFITFIIAVCLALSLSYQHFVVGDNKYEYIVDSDGKGYYAYLPAIFIYHDLSFNFFFENQNQDIKRYFHERFIIKQGDKTIIKTYCGESVLLLPFFAAGCLVQYAYAGEVNGYESIMQFFICIGALFYLALGLFYLRKFLKYYHIEDRIIRLTLVIFVFGTNLLYYTVFHPTMTHVYSFALISMFLYLSKHFIETENKKTIWLVAFVIGLIALVRPVNILVISITPFLKKENGLSFYFSHIKNNITTWVVALLIAAATASIQLYLNFLQCRKVFAWSYGDEGFYFLHPHVSDVLFSFQKGLFIYTPVLIIACIGLFFVLKKQRSLFLGLALTLVPATYIISAWWKWSYGPGFGLRAFIDWYALFVIPFAFLLNNIDRMQERFVKLVCLVLVAFNLFQTWQYLWGIIHAEGMTKEKYAYVFFKTSPEYYNCLGDGVEETYLPKQAKPFLSAENNFADPSKNWEYCPVFMSNGNAVALLNDTIEYGPTLLIKADSPEYFQPFFLKVYLDRYENEFKACTKSLIMVDYVAADGAIYRSCNLRINDLPRKEIYHWKTFDYDFPLPPVKNKGDVLKIYIWNLDRKSFYIDSMKVQFYGYQKRPAT